MRISSKGFTFIELLVALSIIGILATVIMAGTGATRKSGRVAQRVSDMKQVQSALDLYYANNKAYPSTSGNWRSTCSAWGGYAPSDVIKDIPTGKTLVPDYLITMPSDPQMDVINSTSCYLYRSDGLDYAFLDHNVTELSSGPGAIYSKYPELMDPVRLTWAWKVSSPGGVGW